MLGELLEFLKGYIGVKASGGFSEKFINQCSLYGVNVRKIRYKGDGVFFITSPDNYRKVKKIAKLSGMDARITGRFGVPFFINRHRHRIALCVGIALSVIFSILMSTRIWTVRVSGNENVFDTQIISEFEKLGVKIGAKKKNIDIPSVQRDFLEIMNDKIIWVSLNIKGMSAEIQVREVKNANESTDTKPCNIIADFDGILRSIRTFSGTQTENVKSGVKKGDLLISGVVEYYGGTPGFVRAKGEITAEHKVTVSVNSNSAVIRHYTDTKTEYSLNAFTLIFPPESHAENENSETCEKTFSAQLNGIKLPFGITRTVKTSYENVTDETKTRRLYTLKKYFDAVEEKTKNSDVISVKTKYTENTDNLEIKGEIQCVDFMGKSVPINIKTE